MRLSAAAIAGLYFLVCACHESSIVGDTHAGPDAPLDSINDVLEEEIPSWECEEDAECEDGDPCTADACDLATHACTSTAVHGLAFLVDDIQVTDDPRYSGVPRLEWSGSHIGLAWSDGRDGECFDPWGPRYCEQQVYFKTLSPEGESLSADTRVSSTTGVGTPMDVAWTGSTFALAWYTAERFDYQAYLSRIGPDGSLVGAPAQPDGWTLAWPRSIVWTGSEIASLWSPIEESGPAISSALELSRHDPDLVDLGRTLVLDDTTYSYDMAWSGSTFGVVYSGSGSWTARFQLVDADGALVGTGTDLGVRHLYDAQALWTGSEWAFLWSSALEEDEHCGDLRWPECTNAMLVRLDAGGTPVTEITHLTTDDEETRIAGAVWTGSEIGVSWHAATGWGYEAALSRFTVEGERVADDLPLPRPSTLLWTGSEYVIAYMDDRDGAFDIYLNRTVTCE